MVAIKKKITDPSSKSYSSSPSKLSEHQHIIEEAAKKIFDDLGWFVKDNILYTSNNEKVEFNFLLAQKGFERILAPFAHNLKKLGIKLIDGLGDKIQSSSWLLKD